MKTMQKFGGIFAVSLAMMALNASALQISFSDYGVGSWTPANEFNSDVPVVTGVDRAVDIWNGSAAAGVFTSGGNSATFTKGAGNLLPDVLPDVTEYVNRDESSPFSVNNTAGEYAYMTAKYGNKAQQVFYIAAIHDIITVPTSLPGISGSGLSHVTWLEGNQVPQVPDGGTTAMLIGVALSGLALLRRKLG